MEDKPEESNELEVNSLEGENSSDATGAITTPNGDANPTDKKPEKKKRPGGGGIKGLIGRLNIYLVLFIFILVLASIIVVIGMQRSKKELLQPDINTTPLSEEALEKLRNGDTKVGDPKQTLSIESNAIFSGSVLVKGGLDVAGGIKVGGTLNVPGISVSGSSTFDQVVANGMAISGDGSIQGTLNVQNNLVVGGTGQFGGPISAPQITVGSLQLTNDLTITRHIDAGGATPGISGGGLGGGGTASISGSDTAGTVTLNTGGGPGGCLATITFSNAFNGVPHVVISPASASAALISYYVERNTGSFRICAAGAVPGGANLVFDYIAID